MPDVTESLEITPSTIQISDIKPLEGLTNLDALQSEMVQLIALPLKIKDGDGAPARVVAIEA